MSSTAIVGSSSSPNPSSKSNPKGHMRKTRVVRRRGRGRLDGMDSDEEIERAAMSDASDSDEPSLLDSESESEADSALMNGRSHPDTPSTTQSPPPQKGSLKSDFSKPDSNDDGAVAQTPQAASAFFSAAGGSWSDMMAEEGAASVELPVIDFADLDANAVDQPSVKRAKESAPEASTSTDANETHKDTGRLNGSIRGSVRGGPAKRASGHAARQQYQQRLQSDPAFVPTVGEFWGHDPRLISEDMRPMSDWWRFRKFARGRGRATFSPRGFVGRGRGGFIGHAPLNDVVGSDDLTNQEESDAALPIERAWTHDGFEEMKLKEERRRAEQQQRNNRAVNVQPGLQMDRSRGGYVAGRGRGGFSPRRGGFQPSPRRGSPFPAPASRANPDKIWYAMKPERTWTKQLESFLHFDNSAKPWTGKPAGYRVHLPGKTTNFVKLAERPFEVESPAHANVLTQAPSESTSTTEHEWKCIVCLPPSRKKAHVNEKHADDSEATATPESLTTVEQPVFDEAPIATSSKVTLEEGTAEPSVPTHPDSILYPSSGLIQDPPNSLPQPQISREAEATPSLTRDNSVSEISPVDINVITQTDVAPPVDNKPAFDPVAVPQLPPLQTVFPPPSQPSPTYGSPYGYPPSLPPGVALNQQGYAYDIASGRPVYMHPTPPPHMPIYNPRPISHHAMHPSMGFVPGHIHHASLPPDFMPLHTHTPPINGYSDPNMSAPFFLPPRQSSRVEIRAPTDMNDGMKTKGERRPSNLRSTTVANEDASVTQQQPSSSTGSTLYASAPAYVPMDLSRVPSSQMYPALDVVANSPNSDGAPLMPQQPIDPNMMAYGGYQQQYYYPEQYGYAQYMHPGQYDPYASDPSQAPVYYQ